MRHPLQGRQPLILKVVETDQCIACGACVSACSRANLRPIFNPNRGAEEVELIAAEQCVGCPQPCDAVCPSLEIDFSRQRAVLHQGTAERSVPPARDGWMESTFLGWSPSLKDDGVSSSGGVIRSFISQALHSGTPVVCLAWDSSANAFRPRLLTSPEQLPEIPGSIYHSTRFAGAIDLIRQATSPVLLVAIPCQLSGILNYITHVEPALGTKIRLVCGIVCGWMYSFHALEAFARAKGIGDANLAATTYRGGDRVGQLRLLTGNGPRAFDRRHFTTFREALDYGSCFSTDFNRLRCRLCEDHLNLGADIIAGDAWVARNGTRKASILGCRTHRGQQALAALEKAGLLELEPASFADFVESQSSNLVFGIHAQRMNAVLARQGRTVPRFGFTDAKRPVEARIRDQFSVACERLRRRIVRGGHYRVYRWIQLVRRFRPLLRNVGTIRWLLRWK